MRKTEGEGESEEEDGEMEEKNYRAVDEAGYHAFT